MHPKVRCFWEHFDLMQRIVWPAMERKLRDRESRGEYTRDDASGAPHEPPVSNASKSKR
jgi:hypothetical protein